MYGLPQAGLLAQNRLIAHLATHGYHQTEATCLFHHETNGTDFSLVVDDSGVKYATNAGAQHLIDTLRNSTSSLSIGLAANTWDSQLHLIMIST